MLSKEEKQRRARLVAPVLEQIIATKKFEHLLLKVSISIMDGTIELVTPETVYAMLQDALTEALQHSRARHDAINVSLACQALDIKGVPRTDYAIGTWIAHQDSVRARKRQLERMKERNQ